MRLRTLLLFVCSLVLGASAAQAQCTLNSTDPSVTICTPTNGATVTSPVHIVAGTTSSATVTAMKIYLDGTGVYSVNASQLDTNLTIATGTHKITVKAWNKASQVFSQSISITVSSGTTSGGGGGTTGCTASTTDPSVTICSPASGATVDSPVNVVASTTSSSTVKTMKIYLDGVGVYSTSASSINTQISAATGTHKLTVKAWNSASQVFSSTENFTVGTSSGGTGAQDITAIKHVIFMLQENRSFDNYFGQMNAYRAKLGLSTDVDDLSTAGNVSNVGYDGKTVIAPFHMISVCEESLSPSWNESHVQCNKNDPTNNSCVNDGFAYTAGKYATDTGLNDTIGKRAMGYYDWTQLPYYYFMAAQFGISDRWFAPAPTRTQPNRLYLLAATSHGHAYPSGSLDIPQIFSELQSAGVTWRVYMSDGTNSALKYFQPFASNFSGHFVDASQFKTDAANGTLPQVAMIDQASGTDEHPNGNIQKGAAWVASLVNALMQSKSWQDSVFFFAYDEPGGNYDHVPPPAAHQPDGIPPQDLASTDIKGDFVRYSFRVPNIVISPFTKPHYVSHTVFDHTAILRFIEQRFNLPTLTQRDASQADLSEFFDFVNVPWKTPPTPPTQPTDGQCYYSKVP